MGSESWTETPAAQGSALMGRAGRGEGAQLAQSRPYLLEDHTHLARRPRARIPQTERNSLHCDACYEASLQRAHDYAWPAGALVGTKEQSGCLLWGSLQTGEQGGHTGNAIREAD